MTTGFYFDPYLGEGLGALRLKASDTKIADEIDLDTAKAFAASIVAPAVDEARAACQQELEALMAPGVIEGMRRACLLRKDASPEEVLSHLKDVASSYEGIFSRLKEAKKLCAEAIDICVEQDGAAVQALYDLREVLEGS